MKYLTFVLVLFSNICFGQFSKRDFTKITDKLLMYNYEVNLTEYDLFLKSTNYDAQYLPDKSVLSDTSLKTYSYAIDYSELFNSLYSYPVTCLTPFQVESFCKWLNTYLNNKQHFKGKIKSVRLPTLSEYYSVLLKDTIKADYVDNSVIRLNEEPNMETPLMYKVFNSKIFSEENLSGYNDKDLNIFLSLRDNSHNIINLIGNVSEMVYANSTFSKIIPIGNNFTGKISYRTWKPPTLIISLFDDKLPLTSLKVGFRFVIEYK